MDPLRTRSKSTLTINTNSTTITGKSDTFDVEFRPPTISRLFASQTLGWGGLIQGTSTPQPLHKILRYICAFDVIRSLWDTFSMAIILTFVNNFTENDVTLVDKTAKENMRQAEEIKLLTKLNFEHHKESFLFLSGAAVFIFALEIPMALWLCHLTRTRNMRHIRFWKISSYVYLVVNMLNLTGILIYSSKAGLIRDDVWRSGSNIRRMEIFIFTSLLRFIFFDVTKGVELVFLNAFTADLKRNSKKVSLHSSVFANRSSQTSDSSKLSKI